VDRGEGHGVAAEVANLRLRRLRLSKLFHTRRDTSHDDDRTQPPWRRARPP
jgi:hypothetical protein